MAISTLLHVRDSHLNEGEKLHLAGIGNGAIAGMAICLCVLVFVPVAWALFIRRRRRRMMHSPPKQRLEARRELEIVTIASSGHESHRKSNSQSQDSECAICLNDLYYKGESSGSGSRSSALTLLERLQEGENLTLKKCNHMFHGSCLTSWFLLERRDCPVCRADYFEGIVEEKKGWKKFSFKRKQRARAGEDVACGA
ncbi:hypothetical protein G7Y89_g15026 [Cudoniella acicularis]|uniref:RING-type domain-containing protein n=1 Tax=Cudoniella acicularis TaxID=354080 RepID=A0A8H4QVG5_9HELO|nr:hypothetical protein G7Y89_g15026 [Cudoniella acicularis]